MPRERNSMTYKPIVAKLPRSTLCPYHRRGHYDEQGSSTEQNESEATEEDEADRRINSVT